MASSNIIEIRIQVDTSDGSSRVRRFTDDLDGDMSRAKKSVSGFSSTVVDMVKAIGGIAAAYASFQGIQMFAGMVADAENANAKIRAATGEAEEEVRRLGETARSVKPYIGDMAGATDVVIQAYQQLGKISDAEMKKVIQTAGALNKTFAADTAKSVTAVSTLMNDFGLTSQQAMDFVAGGFQKGLDKSGDFLDSVLEYSTQFKSGGADASQFFSVLESGLQGGVLGTDKAADMFKEFRVRIQDGSKTTADSLAMIGLNADDIAKQISSGQITVADAFQLVNEKLKETGDSATVMQAGVGLLGTQFEDLGTEAALAVNMAKTSMSDLAGSSESVNQVWDTSYFKLMELVNLIEGQLITVYQRYEADVKSALSSVIGFVTEHKDAILLLIDAMVRFGEVALAGGVFYAAMIGIPALMASAKAAMMAYYMSVYTANIASMGFAKTLLSVKTAGTATLAFFAGWQIGTMLYNEFEVVRLAGLTLIDYLITAWIEWKYAAISVWEAIQSGFITLLDYLGSGITKIVGVFDATWAGISGGFGSLMKYLTEKFASFLSVMSGGLSGIPGMENIAADINLVAGKALAASNSFQTFNQAISESVNRTAAAESAHKSMIASLRESHTASSSLASQKAAEISQHESIIESIRKEHTEYGKLAEKSLEQADIAKTAASDIAIAEKDSASVISGAHKNLTDEKAGHLKTQVDDIEKAIKEQESLFSELYRDLEGQSAGWYQWEIDRLNEKQKEQKEILGKSVTDKEQHAKLMADIDKAYADGIDDINEKVLKAAVDAQKDQIDEYKEKVDSVKEFDADYLQYFTDQIESMKSDTIEYYKEITGKTELSKDEKLEIDRLYADERKALQDRMLSDTEKRIKEEEQAEQDRLRLYEQYVKELDIATEERYQYEVGKINEKYDAYEKAGFDIVNIEKSRNKELKGISDDHYQDVTDTISKVIETWRKHTEEKKKLEAEYQQDMANLNADYEQSQKELADKAVEIEKYKYDELEKLSDDYKASQEELSNEFAGIFDNFSASGDVNALIDSIYAYQDKKLSVEEEYAQRRIDIADEVAVREKELADERIAIEQQYQADLSSLNAEYDARRSELMSSAYSDWMSMLSEMMGGFDSFLNSMISGMGSGMQGLLSSLSGGSGSGGSVMDTFSGLWSGAKNLFGGGNGGWMDTVGTWASGAWNTVKNWGGSALNTVSQWGAKAWDSVSNWTSGAWGTVKDWASGAWNTVSQWGTKAYDTIAGVGSTVSSAASTTSGAVSAGTSGIGSLGGWNVAGGIANVGSQLMSGGQLFQNKYNNTNLGVLQTIGSFTKYGGVLSTAGEWVGGLFNDTGAQVGSGIGAGAGIGASVGSVIPGIGTAVGAVVGAVIGGIASAFGAKGDPEITMKHLGLSKAEMVQDGMGAMTLEIDKYGVNQDYADIYKATHGAFDTISTDFNKNLIDIRNQIVSEMGEEYAEMFDAELAKMDFGTEFFEKNYNFNLKLHDAGNPAQTMIEKWAEHIYGNLNEALSEVNFQKIIDDGVGGLLNDEALASLKNTEGLTDAEGNQLEGMAKFEAKTQVIGMLEDAYYGFVEWIDKMAGVEPEKPEGVTAYTTYMDELNATFDARIENLRALGFSEEAIMELEARRSEVLSKAEEDFANARQLLQDQFSQKYGLGGGESEMSVRWRTLTDDIAKLEAGFVEMGMSAEEAAASAKELGDAAKENLQKNFQEEKEALLQGYRDTYDIAGGPTEYELARKQFDTDTQGLYDSLILLGVSAEIAQEEVDALSKEGLENFEKKFAQTRENLVKEFAEKYDIDITGKTEYQTAFDNLNTDLAELEKALIEEGMSAELAAEHTAALGDAAEKNLSEKFAKIQEDLISGFAEQYDIDLTGMTEYQTAFADLDANVIKLRDSLMNSGMSMTEATLQAKELGRAAEKELAKKFAEARATIITDAEALAGIEPNRLEKVTTETNAKFDALREGMIQAGGSIENIVYLESLRTQALEKERAAIEAENLGILESAKGIAGLTEVLTPLQSELADVRGQFEGLRQQMIANGATAAQLAELDRYQGVAELNALSKAYNQQNQSPVYSAPISSGSASAATGPTEAELEQSRLDALAKFRSQYISETKSVTDQLVDDLHVLGGELMAAGMSAEEASVEVRRLGEEALGVLIEGFQKANEEAQNTALRLAGLLPEETGIDKINREFDALRETMIANHASVETLTNLETLRGIALENERKAMESNVLATLESARQLAYPLSDLESAITGTQSSFENLRQQMIANNVTAAQLAQLQEYQNKAILDQITSSYIASLETQEPVSFAHGSDISQTGPTEAELEQARLDAISKFRNQYLEIEKTAHEKLIDDLHILGGELMSAGMSAAEASAEVRRLGEEALGKLLDEMRQANEETLKQAESLAILPDTMSDTKKAIAEINSQFAEMRIQMSKNNATADDYARLESYRLQAIENEKNAAHKAEMDRIQSFRDAAIEAFAQITDSIANNIASVQAQIDENNFIAGGGTSSEFIMGNIMSMLTEGATAASIQSASGMLGQWYSAAISEAQATANQISNAGSDFSDSVASSGESFTESVSVAVSSLEELVKSIDDTINEILYSDLNVAVGKEKMDMATRDYEELKTKVMSGTATEEDVAEFQSFAKEYLSMAQGQYKSSAAYQQIFGNVLSDLEAIKGVNIVQEQTTGSAGSAGSAGSGSASVGGGQAEADLSGVYEQFKEIQAVIAQRLTDVKSGEFLFKMDWSGWDGKADSFMDIISPVIAEQGWDSQILLNFLSSAEVDKMDFDQKMKLVGFVGEQSGWESPAILALATNPDFQETLSLDQKMEMLGLMASNTTDGWSAPAILELAAAWGVQNLVKVKTDMQSVGLTPETASWDTEAILETSADATKFTLADVVNALTGAGINVTNGVASGSAEIVVKTDNQVDLTTVDGVMKLLGFVGSTEGWESPAMIALASSIDSTKLDDPIKDSMNLLGFTGSQAGWESPATMALISNLRDDGIPWDTIQTTLANYGVTDAEVLKRIKAETDSQSFTDVGTEMEKIGITPATTSFDNEALLNIATNTAEFVAAINALNSTMSNIGMSGGGWSQPATLEVKSDITGFDISDAESAIDSLKFVEKEGGGWGSKAILELITQIGEDETLTFNDKLKALKFVASDSEEGWNSEATLTFISSIDSETWAADVATARKNITWMATESGDWNGKATLTLLSTIDSDKWGTDVKTAADSIAWMKDGSGWDGEATLKLISSVDETAWTTDIKATRDYIAWMGTEQGWDGKATLQLISSVPAEVWTGSVEEMKSHLGWVSDQAGWDGEATLSLVSSLSDTDLTWADIKQILVDYGVIDTEVVKKIKAAYDSGVPGLDSFSDLEIALHDEGVSPEVIKTIKGEYIAGEGAMTLDDLGYFLAESGVPDDIIRRIETNIGGQVEAQLGDDPNLAYLDNINTNIAEMHSGVNDVACDYLNSINSTLSGGITVTVGNQTAAATSMDVNVTNYASFPVSDTYSLGSKLDSISGYLSTISGWQAGEGHKYGGMSYGPESGYMALLHGNELVVSPKASYPATVMMPKYENTENDNQEIKALLRDLIAAVRESKGDVVVKNEIDLEKFDNRAKRVYDEMRVKVDNRGQRVTGRRMVQ